MAYHSEKVDEELYNVYEEVIFEYDTRKKVMHVNWDPTNEVISNIMVREQSPYSDQFYNVEWLSKFKNFVEWEKGEPLYPYIITDSKSGQFSVKLHRALLCDDFACIKIDEDGYLFTRPFINGEFKKNLVRTKCVYNDNMESMELPYILK
jgi:hypothetical protein